VSRSIGSELPDELRTALDGERLEDGIGLIIELLTADEDEWPSVALLSVGEVVAPSASTVRLALWPGTTATRNLTRSGKGTLALFEGGLATYIRVATERGDDIAVGGMHHATFEGAIVDILRDEVTYARMTRGLTFDLPDAPKVLARWQATVAALLGAESGDEPTEGPGTGRDAGQDTSTR
jgi:hypothetical protein